MRETKIVAVVREFFWQGDALTRLGPETFWSGSPGWSEFVLGSSALQHADRLRRNGDRANPAVLLYASAARLLLHARAAREGKLEVDLKLTSELEDVGAADRGRVQAWLSPSGESTLSRLEPPGLRHAESLLRRIATGWHRKLSQRTKPARRILVRRWLRTALLPVAALACLVYLGVDKRPNLALHARVSLPHPDAAYNPRLLVDGNRENLGFHTASGPNEVTLDLGSPKRISRVAVYNRMDCCQERAVPLAIAVQDNRRYRTVANRTGVFDLWRAEFPPVSTRFVRLISKNPEPFHLAEVEVY